MKDKYPKAWADFEKWMREWIVDIEVGGKKWIFSVSGKIDVMLFFNGLQFEMQLGVYLKYIEENGIGIHSNSIANYNIEVIREKIEQAFKMREEQITKVREKQSN